MVLPTAPFTEGLRVTDAGLARLRNLSVLDLSAADLDALYAYIGVRLTYANLTGEFA